MRGAAAAVVISVVVTAAVAVATFFAARRSLALAFGLVMASLIAASSSIGAVKDPFVTARWGALLVLAAVLARPLPARPAWGSPEALFAAIAATFILSTAWSIDPRLTAMRAVSVAVLLWVVLMLFGSGSRPRVNVRELVDLLAALSVVSLALSLLLWVVDRDAAMYAGDLRGIFENQNGLGLFLGLSYPFVLAAAETRLGPRTWLPLLGVPYLATIALAEARTGLLAFVIAAVVFEAARRQWRRMAMVGAVVVLAVVTGVTISGGDGANQANLSTMVSGGRDEAWSATVELAAQRPFLGYGFGTGDLVFARHPDVAEFVDFQGENPASGYLHAVLELGLLSFLVVCALALAAYRAFATARGRRLSLLGASFAAALFAGLAAAVFESLLTTAGAPWSPLIWLCAAAALHDPYAREQVAVMADPKLETEPTEARRAPPRKLETEPTEARRAPAGKPVASPVTTAGWWPWVAAAVAGVALIGGAVAAFAVYSFGWRDTSATTAMADERGRAMGYAERVARDRCGQRTCTVSDLDRLASGLWKARLEGAQSGCFLIDVGRFALTEAAPTTGVGSVACSNAPVRRADVLSVAFLETEPGWLISPKTDPTGFEADLVEELARRLDLSIVQWRPIRRDRLTNGMLRAVDLAIGRFEPDRLPTGAVSSDAYFHDDYFLLGTGDLEERSLRTWRDVRRLRLGSWEAEPDGFIRTTIRPRSRPKSYRYHWNALKDLGKGDLDGVIASLPWARQLVESQPALRIVGQLRTGREFTFALKDESLLLDRVNEELREMRRSGALRRLQERWFPGTTAQPVIE